MRRDKRQSAERLFEVIGMIDDSIIAENQEISPSRKNFFSLSQRRFVPLLAAVLVFTVCLSAMFAIAQLGDEKTDLPEDDKSNTQAEDEGHTYQKHFDSVMSSASLCADVKRVSVNDLDLFCGAVELIWSYVDEDEFYKLTIGTDESAEAIKEKLQTGYKQLSSYDAELCDYRVWISYGNGVVMSPQLKYSYSGGNVGYGKLFEYSPEVVPSNEFVELIEKIVN